MTNERELRRTQAHLDDAVKKGAKIIVGGNPRPDIGAFFFEPTILVDVDHSMDVMRDETFGPVMPIMKVKNQEEAIRLANDSNYGLSASIFSNNHKRAKEIALQLDTICHRDSRFAERRSEKQWYWSAQRSRRSA